MRDLIWDAVAYVLLTISMWLAERPGEDERPTWRTDLAYRLASFLPDRCEDPTCSGLNVRGNENIVDGRILCDDCSMGREG
jgi:hypothetical protein